MFLLPLSLGAYDFGLLTNQHVGISNSAGDDNAFEYSAGILPRFSFLVGETGSFIISAGLTLGYDEKFYFVPELMRTEFSMRFGAWGIRAGRINYSDPLSFIAEGLFDGAQLTHSSPFGRFGFGAWYTGLLYKRTANITMTAEDAGLYSSDLDYGDFSNTYFAPRRLLFSLDWEHPSVGKLLRLKTALTGQVDLSDKEEKYNSQYLILKAGIPVNNFLFEVGGSLETAQHKSPLAGDESSSEDFSFNMAMAFDLGIFWTLPVDIISKISFNCHYASGKINDNFGQFVPVTTKYYGEIFQSKMTGITVLALNYSARLAQSLGTNIAASYFVRNDLVTYNSYPIKTEGDDGYFLGGEIFAKLIWSPVSDIQFSLGGGAFIPAMGDNWPDEKPKWRVDLSAILALY